VSDGFCLVDTNVLLRWVQPQSLDFLTVSSALERLTRRNVALCYTSQNLGEFWNACTRPLDRNGFGLTPAETDDRAKWIESRIRLLPDSSHVHQEWRRLLVSHQVSGAQVHDARLVAAMHVYGIQAILTFNGKDFVRFTTIQVTNPRDVLP
jgi:predicted nucleic acid-binding protein